jgi:hypothetical protein
MVLAVFTMAMFYASVCSASCAAGVCPDKVQQTAGHGPATVAQFIYLWNAKGFPEITQPKTSVQERTLFPL